MRTRTLTNTLLVTATLTSLAMAGCEAGQITVSVDESVAQEEVAKQFPIERDLKMKAKMKMLDPVIDLSVGDNRIGLTTNLEIQRENLPIVIKGKAKTTGALRYEGSDATFYMTDIKIEDVDLAMGLGNNTKIKQRLLEAANTTLASSYKDIPIYTLRDSRGESTATALLQKVEVADKKIKLTLGLGEKK